MTGSAGRRRVLCVIAGIALVACGDGAPSDDELAGLQDPNGEIVDGAPATTDSPDDDRSTTTRRDDGETLAGPAELPETSDVTSSPAAAADAVEGNAAVGGTSRATGERVASGSSASGQRPVNGTVARRTPPTAITPGSAATTARSTPLTTRPRPATTQQHTTTQPPTTRPQATTTQPTTTRPLTTSTRPRTTTTRPRTATTQPLTTTTPARPSTTTPRATTTTTTTTPSAAFVPVGGESSFSYYLGGSFSAAKCPSLAISERRNLFVGSQHRREDHEGATVGWRVHVCLSDDEDRTQSIVEPVSVTRPDGHTYDPGEPLHRGDCARSEDDGCVVVLDFRAGPEHLGVWTVRVALDDPTQTIEHVFTVAVPDQPAVIASGASLLVSGAPGSRPRIAAILARAECERGGPPPPDEVCIEVGHDDEPTWYTVLQAEIPGPVIGDDGTALFDPPSIDWPPVPDPEPGLPYDGPTRVCYAVIHGGTLAGGLDINQSDCRRT